jgi:hypothetical protein
MLHIKPDKNLIPKEVSYSSDFVHEQIKQLNTKINALYAYADATSSAIGIYKVKESIIQELTDLQKDKLNIAIATSHSFTLTKPHNYSHTASLKSMEKSTEFRGGHMTNLSTYNSLTSYSPFVSVLGQYDIPFQNNLLVSILEAKDLKPFVTGKLEDVYCKVYLRNSNLSELALKNLTE